MKLGEFPPPSNDNGKVPSHEPEFKLRYEGSYQDALSELTEIKLEQIDKKKGDIARRLTSILHGLMTPTAEFAITDDEARKINDFIAYVIADLNDDNDPFWRIMKGFEDRGLIEEARKIGEETLPDEELKERLVPFFPYLGDLNYYQRF